MRVSIFTLAAAAVLAAAVPASALTVQPVSATPAAAAVKALGPDPAAGLGESFRAAVAGDSAGVSGLPVYFEPTQAGSEADEARYAADPVHFMAQVDATKTAAAPSPAAAPKPTPKGR